MTERIIPPAWVEMFSPKSSLVLAHLDQGESEAIALATETHAKVVFVDEQAGRQEALRRGLKVAGTVSVLDEAHALPCAPESFPLPARRRNAYLARLLESTVN